MLSTVTYRKKEMEVLVNVSKTKVMVFIGGERVEQINEFVYLV